MIRRMMWVALVAGALAALPASAQTYAETLVELLKQDGYTRVATSRTMLGRTRVVAYGDTFIREIILDPNTGEILRDLSRPSVVVVDNGSDSDSGSASAGPSGVVASATATMVETMTDSGADALSVTAPDSTRAVEEPSLLPSLSDDGE